MDESRLPQLIGHTVLGRYKLSARSLVLHVRVIPDSSYPEIPTPLNFGIYLKL